jgi:hypothetical protein
MSILAVIVVVLLVLGAAGIAAWSSARKKQTERLRERFGPEYDRALSSAENRVVAEKELSGRERRVESLPIRELEWGERAAFDADWQIVQGRFIDDPSYSIGEADLLVQELMEARGYPVTTFFQVAADISVNHAGVVRNYRAAHAIAESDARGTATTEDLRQAMIHYRALFSDLLGEPALAGRR